MKTKITFYEIFDGDGYLGKNGNYTFETAQEAIDVAAEFKNDPTTHNYKMEKSSIAYWKSKFYTINKKTVVTENIAIKTI